MSYNQQGRGNILYMIIYFNKSISHQCCIRKVIKKTLTLFRRNFLHIKIYLEKTKSGLPN